MITYIVYLNPIYDLYLRMYIRSFPHKYLRDKYYQGLTYFEYHINMLTDSIPLLLLFDVVNYLEVFTIQLTLFGLCPMSDTLI